MKNYLKFILFVTLFPMSVVIAFAGPCGEKFLSDSDKRVMRLTEGVIAQWMKYYSVDMPNQKKDGASAQDVLRGLVPVSDHAMDKVKQAYNSTSNQGLRKFYRKMYSLVSELRDLALVGDRLITAQRQNNFSMLGGMVGMVTRETLIYSHGNVSATHEF